MDTNLYGLAIVPLIIGLVEMVKKLGLPEKFAPVLAIVLGIFSGLLLAPTNVAQAVVVGVALGLSAVGLYSGTKNTLIK